MPALPVGISQPTQLGRQSTVSNSRDPVEQPQAFEFNFDFTAATSYVIDMTMEMQQGRVSNIQTIYVDNSTNNQTLLISVSGSGQPISISAGAQTYIPVLCPTPAKFTLTCTGSTANNIFLALINVPMPFSQWFPYDAHSNGGNAYAASNINATTAAFTLPAGNYAVDYTATWAGGSVTLEKLAGNGTTWITATAAWTADGTTLINLPAGTYRLAVAGGATAAYVQFGLVSP